MKWKSFCKAFYLPLPFLESRDPKFHHCKNDIFTPYFFLVLHFLMPPFERQSKMQGFVSQA